MQVLRKMLTNYKIIIQYDGSRYSGWQKQGNTDNTIEAKLSAVITRMSGEAEPVEVHGSGRTDAGVHAMGQVASFKLHTDMSADKVMDYINTYLPEDIKVLSAEKVDNRFHARLSATSKTYEYNICNAAKADVFTRAYSWHIAEKLDEAVLRSAAEVFIGEHDFYAFCDLRSKKKSTVRRVDDIQIVKTRDEIKLVFNGEGFLYHMVRRLTAAMTEAALGHVSVGELARMLDNADTKYMMLAPAKGLVLREVFYNKE